MSTSHEYCDGCIRGRECDLQALDQRIHRHYRLAEQEIGEAPHHCMLASSARLETLSPSVRDRSQLAQQVHCMATRGDHAFEKQLDP